MCFRNCLIDRPIVTRYFYAAFQRSGRPHQLPASRTLFSLLCRIPLVRDRHLIGTQALFIQFGYPCALDSDMNESNHLDDEPRDLDLSSLTFDEFEAFFFAREVVSDDEQYGYFLTDLHGETYFDSVPSSPEVLINNLTKLFTQFGQLGSK